MSRARLRFSSLMNDTAVPVLPTRPVRPVSSGWSDGRRLYYAHCNGRTTVRLAEAYGILAQNTGTAYWHGTGIP